MEQIRWISIAMMWQYLDLILWPHANNIPPRLFKEVKYFPPEQKYPYVLQTTSCNFSRTAVTGELSAGVVKVHKVLEKNPAQHMADLCLLEHQNELRPVFFNQQTEMPKSVEWIRVDGVSDELPSHEEVQYWWTEKKESLAMLVITQSSSCSYFNRVELQNGCLGLGHAHTFISSTLGGNQQTGEIDDEKLRRNMDLAIEVSRVDKCPADTCIHLYRWADASVHVETCDSLLTFLKGSKTAKDTLHWEKPNLYARFQLMWNVRQNHMVKFSCLLAALINNVGIQSARKEGLVNYSPSTSCRGYGQTMEKHNLEHL